MHKAGLHSCARQRDKLTEQGAQNWASRHSALVKTPEMWENYKQSVIDNNEAYQEHINQVGEEYGNAFAFGMASQTKKGTYTGTSTQKQQISANNKVSTEGQKNSTNNSGTENAGGKNNQTNPQKAGTLTLFENAGNQAKTVIDARVGGGARIESIAKRQQEQIQKMADKWQVEITVIGSRARGTSHAESDWDCIVSEIKPRMIHDLKSNLPKSPASSAEIGRARLEIFNGQTYPVDQTKAYIIFSPSKK
jgi:hypothetical protein